MTPPKLLPALLGGAFIGVLSALPLVNVANCCCLWLITGGALAAWVMQQNHPAPIRAGDGALVGFLAGMVGAFVYVVVAAPISLLMAPIEEAMRSRVLEGAQEMPPEVRDALTRFGSGGAGLAIGFAMNLLLGMIFSTLGGVLGAVWFKKPGPPPAPPAVDPTWAPPSVSWAPPVPPPAAPPGDATDSAPGGQERR
jgi:hypothetical protein